MPDRTTKAAGHRDEDPRARLRDRLQHRDLTTAHGSRDGHEGAAVGMTRPCPADPTGRQVDHAATADGSSTFVDGGVVQIQSLVAGARELGKGDHGVLLE
jgi:hypothetical protein